jgi:hypothetical protein
MPLDLILQQSPTPRSWSSAYGSLEARFLSWRGSPGTVHDRRNQQMRERSATALLLTRRAFSWKQMQLTIGSAARSTAVPFGVIVRRSASRSVALPLATD